MSDDELSDESYPLVYILFSFIFVCVVTNIGIQRKRGPDVDLENQYYNSKALKENNPPAALDSFAQVLELEEEKGEWGFKALKQMMKLHFKLVSPIGYAH